VNFPNPKDAFRPAWWLPGGHLQTLWPALMRRRIALGVRRERLELADGDFLDLDWVGGESGSPIVVILHGLAGSAESPYVRGMARAIARRGWRAVVMHFRGCSGEPNRLLRFYHSGETGDLDTVMRTLRRREAGTKLAAVGYSLGGNVLVKWLGELGGEAPLVAAAAVSVPYDLAKSSRKLGRGLSRLYQHHLIALLRRAVVEKQEKLGVEVVSNAELKSLRTFWEFDDRLTARVHGFSGAAQYYAESSGGQYVKDVRMPLLLVQAEDDPFSPAECAPKKEELPPGVELRLTRHGGHVGFVCGAWPWRPEYWLEKSVVEFLATRLEG
jgi:predicted alpha/beta-fold hydrolase